MSSVITGTQSVYLSVPEIEKINFRHIIIATLNIALITKFSVSGNQNGNCLGVCTAPDGGVQGFYRGNFVELRNMNLSGYLGLWATRPSKESLELLRFYRIMLGYLFEGNSENVAGRYSKGEILRLERSPTGQMRACQILTSALVATRGKHFAMKVAGNLDNISKRLDLTVQLMGH